MIDFGFGFSHSRIGKSPWGVHFLASLAALVLVFPCKTSAASTPAPVTQVPIRILQADGAQAGAKIRWKLEPRGGGDSEGIAGQLPPGEVTLVVQDSATRAPIRVEVQDAKSLEGRGVLMKDMQGGGFSRERPATLAFRMSAQGVEESKKNRRRSGRWDVLGTWALYAGYSGVGYSEDFRPNLTASYLALSGWGDWGLGDSGRYSIRAELSTEALPLESKLDQAVSGEQATLARFVRGGASFSARAFRFGDAWKVLVRPGFSFATMLISNPQFGYFNMTGPSVFLSLQDVPRQGRKLYLDAGIELLNTAPFAFDLGSYGLSARAGGSIAPLGFGEVDAYLKYRAVQLEIDSIEIAESAFEVGLGYRW